MCMLRQPDFVAEPALRATAKTLVDAVLSACLVFGSTALPVMCWRPNARQLRVAHLLSSMPRCGAASCATDARPPALRAATASCGTSVDCAFLERVSRPWLRDVGFV